MQLCHQVTSKFLPDNASRSHSVLVQHQFCQSLAVPSRMRLRAPDHCWGYSETSVQRAPGCRLGTDRLWSRTVGTSGCHSTALYGLFELGAQSQPESDTGPGPHFDLTLTPLRPNPDPTSTIISCWIIASLLLDVKTRQACVPLPHATSFKYWTFYFYRCFVHSSSSCSCSTWGSALLRLFHK